MKSVLVTGVGALIGYGIINSLRASQHKVRIVGMDIYPDAYGRHLADDFVRAVPANSDAYNQFVLDVVDRFKIDIIIPGIEQDLYALHEVRSNLPVKLVTNNELALSLGMDKLKTFQFLQEAGIAPIPTMYKASYAECVKNLGSPFLIKPIRGSASKGIQIIATADEFDFYLRQNREFLCQRIVGSDEHEFTISLFGDGKGGFFDSIVLRRKLSQEGATSKAVMVKDDEQIMSFARRICEIIRPLGPTNLQVRTEGSLTFLLEINPRISSACSIRTAMGYNEPAMCIDYYLLGKDPVAQPKSMAIAIRYIADHFSYE